MFVYILRSLSNQTFYVGISANLSDRLERHNGGRSKATKHGMPWEIRWSCEVENRSEAVLLERKIKKRGAQRFLNDIGG